MKSDAGVLASLGRINEHVEVRVIIREPLLSLLAQRFKFRQTFVLWFAG